jgi:hypothetical protein
MAPLNGIELIAYVRKSYPLLPIVMCTDPPTIQQETMLAGADVVVDGGRCHEIGPHMERLLKRGDEGGHGGV